jgi:putative hemolysin
MLPLRRGRYIARIASLPEDTTAAQNLRRLVFLRASVPDRSDTDSFDASHSHMLIEDQQTGELVCCYRFLVMRSGAEVPCSYAAQHYDLTTLSRFWGPLVEMGRFCIRPGLRDPDILRLAWAAMTMIVDRESAEMLFGCASFRGAFPERHRHGLAYLAAGHIAPDSWRPDVRAAEVVWLNAGDGRPFDLKSGMQGLPSLLRSYLQMGGRVSDHAVIDRDLDTLHVFTGVEVRSIPPVRKRLLRALAT